MARAHSHDPPVRLFLLGGLRAERNGEPVPDSAWKRRSARALVKLLALAPGYRLHREQVIDLLWPDTDPAAGANNLYQALHAARRALDADASGSSSCLRVANDLVLLDPERVWVDADHFQRTVAQGLRSNELDLLEAALEGYRGELLPEDRYEDWVAARRETLSGLHLRVLLHLAGLLEERGQTEAAAERLSQALAVDPTQEEVQRRLMRLHATSGNRSQALRQYQACCEALRRELDAEPEEETRQLYEEVVAGRVAPHTMTQRVLPTLPEPPTPLVGREQEITEIQELYQQTGARLVTLSGPGGVGKTRLALAAGASLIETFADGVVFVSLAALTDDRLVSSSIAAALAIEERGERSLPEALVAGLADRSLLLILDNFEQVTPAASLVEHLLAHCPRLAVLVTSRTLLHLAREYDFQVEPLPVPDPAHLPELGQLQRYDAIRLFEQRARAARRGFVVSAANLVAMAQICARLDGLPLAIELAAARVRVLSPGALLARLQDALHLLSGGPKDAPERQQTLRNTICWSYELLDPAEQRMFALLAVFVGGCTLEAIEVVCDPIGEFSGEVFDQVASLVEKSLLLQGEDQLGAAEARFRMLETIRQYAAERLAETGIEAQIREEHARYYLALAEAAAPELAGPQQATRLARLETEHDNLRAALHYLLEHDESEIALRLAVALWRFWIARGHLSEGRRWLEQALAGAEEYGVDVSLQANGFLGAAALAIRQCDSERARSLAERSLILSRRLGDTRGMANALNSLGQVATDLGDHQRARALHEESLALRREVGDVRGISISLNNLGDLAMTAGDYERAERLLEESVKLARKVGDVASMGVSLSNLGELALLQGSHARARELYEQTLDVFQELEHTWGISRALLGLASVACAEGDTTRAAQLYEESLVLVHNLGDKGGKLRALIGLGDAARSRGDDGRAVEYYEESVDLARDLGNKQELARALCNLGDVQRAQGKSGRAGDLYEESLALFCNIGNAAGVERCLEGLSSFVS